MAGMGIERPAGPVGPGELARLTGVSTDTLRHYERMGVLQKPSRTASGYRRYSPESLDRVRMVRQALGVGFRLAELARFLRARERGGVPCQEVRTLAEEKLREMGRQIAALKGLRGRLRAMLKKRDKRLAATPRGQHANLLESLGGATNHILESGGKSR